MTRTAYDEHYGVGIDQDISADYILRLPYGENGATCYVLRPSVAGLNARLPLAAWAGKWTRYTIANHGAHSLNIRDLLGTLIYALAVGERITLTLTDTTTLWGTWVTNVKTSALGTTLVHDRTPLRVSFGTWAGNGINLRDYCNTALRYDGSKPSAIYCQLRNNIVIGSEITSQPAFDTGTWPAGTTVLLEIQAGCKIVGIGGRGGNGQNWPASVNPQDGFPGGDAIVTRIDMGLVNYGTISSGGGGGGGGRAVSGVGGGGGGGGAGYQPSQAGNGGTPGGFPGSLGGIGTNSPGGNGGQNGGFGGAPGLDGSPATGGGQPNGGAGGARGNAIKRLSTVTVNKIVAGTINGPEVSF